MGTAPGSVRSNGPVRGVLRVSRAFLAMGCPVLHTGVLFGAGVSQHTELLRALRCCSRESLCQLRELLRQSLQPADLQRRLPPGTPYPAADSLDTDAESAF